ncbi:hypothetical protein BDZ97DRAFT_542165 [Flammula alnicola]|nr:hypothetical protein BDZ97DRAFT_542165 [Flammula alnicola]
MFIFSLFFLRSAFSNNNVLRFVYPPFPFALTCMCTVTRRKGLWLCMCDAGTESMQKCREFICSSDEDYRYRTSVEFDLLSLLHCPVPTKALLFVIFASNVVVRPFFEAGCPVFAPMMLKKLYLLANQAIIVWPLISVWFSLQLVLSSIV